MSQPVRNSVDTRRMMGNDVVLSPCLNCAKPAAVARCVAALSSANSPRATQHNHCCHVCRMGQIRNERMCVAASERESGGSERV